MWLVPTEDGVQTVQYHSAVQSLETAANINYNLYLSSINLEHLFPSILKGELRNRFHLFSKERVKFYEQNSENLIKIGWNIRKLWHFKVSQIFTKQFLTSRYEYANERVDDVIASLLAIYFVHKTLKNKIFWKIKYFAQTCDSMSHVSSCIGVSIILHLFREELREV